MPSLPLRLIVLVLLALAAPASADPVHAYTDTEGDAKVGAQEHLTSASAGAYATTHGDDAELHVRVFFTHCTTGTANPGEVTCAV